MRAPINRLHLIVIILFSFLLTACGGSGSNDDNQLPTANENTATLNSDVIVVSSGRDDWIAFSTENTWNLREIRNDISVNSVLLLDDDAIKVTGIKIENGVSVLDIVPAEINDVFSKVNITSEINFNDATIEVENSSGAQLISQTSTLARDIENYQLQKRLATSGLARVRIPINKAPFSGSIDFIIIADMSFNYEDDKTEGFLDVTGSIDVDTLAKLSGSGILNVPEVSVATIRIPVPFTVVDSALRVLGIRIASVMVPVKLGAEATAAFDVGIQFNGSVQSNVRVDYDEINNLDFTGPINSASFEINGEVPADDPDAIAMVNISVGPYVRARPQLLILNKVASLGTDIKIGMYGDGEVQVKKEEPFYCITAQPKIKATVSGFFKAVGINELKSTDINGSKNIGEPFEKGICDVITYDLEKVEKDENTELSSADILDVKYKISPPALLAGQSVAFEIPELNSLLEEGQEDTSKIFLNLGGVSTAITTKISSTSLSPPSGNVTFNEDSGKQEVFFDSNLIELNAGINAPSRFVIISNTSDEPISISPELTIELNSVSFNVPSVLKILDASGPTESNPLTRENSLGITEITLYCRYDDEVVGASFPFVTMLSMTRSDQQHFEVVLPLEGFPRLFGYSIAENSFQFIESGADTETADNSVYKSTWDVYLLFNHSDNKLTGTVNTTDSNQVDTLIGNCSVDAKIL